MPIELWPIYVLRLAAGILAIQSPSVPVNPERATAWAAAAAYYGLMSGEDPFELIGLARNESDFSSNVVGPDGKDCGLTQTRVTFSRYTCRQLQRDDRLAFKEAVRELSEYRRSCRYARDFDRCRLNRYNSGVRYARTGEHGRYWLRVTCFAEAARALVTPGNECRRVKSREDIARLLRESPPAGSAEGSFAWTGPVRMSRAGRAPSRSSAKVRRVSTISERLPPPAAAGGHG